VDILALLQCLPPYMGGTSTRQLSQIIQGMLAMTGRVTRLGISRWTGPGGSYRTIQRFFATALPWATLMWVFFRQYLWCAQEAYLLAGDEVVVTKSGQKTYGLERFFASLYGQSVSGLSFFMVNLSHYLMKSHRGEGLSQSVLDLKSLYRGYKYVAEMIKLLPEKPEPVLLAQIYTRISSLGRIHKVSANHAS